MALVRQAKTSCKESHEHVCADCFLLAGGKAEEMDGDGFRVGQRHQGCPYCPQSTWPFHPLQSSLFVSPLEKEWAPGVVACL